MWRIEPDRPELTRGGDVVTLTTGEWLLLDRLIAARGGVVDRGRLLDTLYPSGNYPSSDRAIDSHVKKIRAKIRAARQDSNPIKTVNGWGYQWKDEQPRTLRKT